MMNIIISNPEKFDNLKQILKTEGLDKVHILSDFDRTLTYGSVDGVKTSSIMSLLRDGKHLSSDYVQKAHELFDTYHPIEVDSNIPLEERKDEMREWWQKHNDLLISSGLSLSDLEDIAKNGHLKFREGVLDFLDFLKSKNIPLIIFSASGCGDAIELFFKKYNKDYSNIYYLTNKFNWDENGRAISTKGPIIHSLNKDETVLSDIPEIFNIIKDRKNVILLGDSLGDVDMINGFDYDNLIKIGFLNFEYNKNREEYQSNFDVVLEGDGDFSFINNIILNFN